MQNWIYFYILNFEREWSPRHIGKDMIDIDSMGKEHVCEWVQGWLTVQQEQVDELKTLAKFFCYGSSRYQK